MAKTVADVTTGATAGPVDDARDVALLKKVPCEPIPCSEIPLDWRSLAPVLRKFLASSSFTMTLNETEYDGGAISDLTVEFTRRDAEVSYAITSWTLRALEEAQVPADTLAVLNRLTGKVYPGQYGNLDLLDDVRAAFGPERDAAFKAVRPLLLNHIRSDTDVTVWTYFEPKQPLAGTDQASVTQESESGKEQSRSKADRDRLQEAARSHILLITDVIPFLAECDKKLKAAWDAAWPRMRDAVERMQTWVNAWREDPRTQYWFFTRPQRLRITEASLQSVKAAGASDDVVTKLRPLVNQDIPEPDFAGRVKAAIGDESAGQHLAAITEHAIRLGDTPTASRSFPAQLNYDDSNPEDLRKCAARTTFCPMRIHFEWERPKENESSGTAGILTDAGVRELETTVSAISRLLPKAAGGLRLTVRGLTDRPGTPDFNRDLSRRRGEWVVSQLRTRLSSFPFKDARVVGCGEARGAAASDPEARYAEVIVQPE